MIRKILLCLLVAALFTMCASVFINGGTDNSPLKLLILFFLSVPLTIAAYKASLYVYCRLKWPDEIIELYLLEDLEDIEDGVWVAKRGTYHLESPSCNYLSYDGSPLKNKIVFRYLTARGGRVELRQIRDSVAARDK